MKKNQSNQQNRKKKTGARPPTRDAMQDRAIANLSKRVKQLAVSKNKRQSRKLHPNHTHLLRADHGSTVVGLMDSKPTAAVTTPATVAVTAAANQNVVAALWPGSCKAQSTGSSIQVGDGPAASTQTTVYDTTGTVSNFASGSTTRMRERLNPTLFTGSCPYSFTSTMASKCNKLSVHVAFTGAQNFTSIEFRMLVDVTGTLFSSGRRLADGNFWSRTEQAVFDTIWSHQKAVRVKLDSGNTFNYSVPLPTAKLTSMVKSTDIIGYRTAADASNANATANSGYDDTGAPASSVGQATTDVYWPVYTCDVDDPNLQPNMVRFNNWRTNEFAVVREPLIYIAASCPISCTLSVSSFVDAEYEDSSLISISKPSPMDVSAAHALHAVCNAAHFEAHRTPIHEKLTFKSVLKKVQKSEHVVSSVAASPLGEAVLAAALA